MYTGGVSPVTIKKKIVLVLIFCVSDTIIAFARFGQFFFFLLHQCSYAGIYSDRIGAVLVGLVMHAARCFFFLAGGFAIVTHSHHHNLFQIHGEFLAQPQKATCLTGRL